MLDDIIPVEELENNLKIKERTEKDYIRSYAFSMFDTHASTDSNVRNILRIAKEMGFYVGTSYTIHFDLVTPGTEANDIMNEVIEFKNDIIAKINNAIKQWDSEENRIVVFINLNNLLNKYKVYRLSSSSYSFTWLKPILKQAGYDSYIQNCRNDNVNIIVYSIALAWE